MKLPFTIYDCRLPIEKKSAGSAASSRRAGLVVNRKSPIVNRKSAMALVITLIMLSVTLVMVVAFLAVSRRERASVTTSAEGTTARLAAETALAAAQSQILANILSSGNGSYNSRLVVSTNYINGLGFTSGSGNPTNVSYTYADGTPLNNISPNFDRNQNIANLQFLPRAPVMMSSNEPAGRFYLDLNRNGAFEDTGDFISAVDFFGVTNETIGEIGDPQWIGILERPDTTHSPDNKFISRYAYIVLPVGNSLDINHIHNQAKHGALSSSVNNPVPPSGDTFLRNQGVGSWEINLAAFLADLNTNQWLKAFPPANGYYAYNQALPSPFTSVNSGVAFDDARALLSYRYDNNYNSLASANSLFVNANNVFPFDNIDEYGDGRLQDTTTNTIESLQPDVTSVPWPGADNTNRFFSSSDFLDRTKTQVGVGYGFTDRLINAGTNTYNNSPNVVPTYDRYTFYRMLDQLGTDSTPDDEGKLDLNYDNTDRQGHIVPNAQTNLFPWTALAFFTNAADRMLRLYTTNWFQNNPSNYLATYYGIHSAANIDPATGYGLNDTLLGANLVPSFGITKIPVMISNQFVYSPAVNRVLQLAANIYDASTNSFYPSVFRPTFAVTNNPDGTRNVFINGYEEVISVSGTGDTQLSQPISVRSLPPGFTDTFHGDMANVFGVPWIIGAKKFMPNFNQFYSFNTVQLSRKLQFTRSSPVTWVAPNQNLFRTNQMMIMSITNHIGFSLWNSYTANYPGGPVDIVVKDISVMQLEISGNPLAVPGLVNPSGMSFTFSARMSPWPGSAWDTTRLGDQRASTVNRYSFTNGTFEFPFLAESVVQFDSAGNLTGFTPVAQNPPPTFNPLVTSLPIFPRFGLAATNYLQAFMVDGTHVIDYVQLDGPNGIDQLDNEMKDQDFNAGGQTEYMWSTNTASNGLNWGVHNQIDVSQTDLHVPSGGKWSNPGNMPSTLPQIPSLEAKYFQSFFTGSNFVYNFILYQNTNLIQQAPYTPTRTRTTATVLAANDPLVHYLMSDLNNANVDIGQNPNDDPTVAFNIPSTTSVSDRYQPWAWPETKNKPTALIRDEASKYNIAFKDPLVYDSDSWDFPGKKYPSSGWLGRVHRGTPWQTVYLKAANILAYSDKNIPADGQVTWTNWLGDADLFDAKNSAPSQDSRLFDLFTTALDDNASRGMLSVNQTHLASWSAVLSGVNVVSNSTPDVPNYDLPNYQTNIVIDPAGIDAANTPLGYIVNNALNGINATRANTNLFPNQTFSRVGDILRVPTLTEQSPFINTNDANHLNYDISDEIYERIPQQVMGLLRVGTPRFVVYCYGQTLRPAPDGTVLGGNYFGMVTNYQVAAESAARAVVSVQPKVVFTANGPVTNYTTKVESFNVLPPE